MGLNEKMLNVIADLNAPKGQYNSFGKYAYRSCEDILEALKPLLKQHGLTVKISDEVVLIGDRYYIKSTTTATDVETGENTSATAFAREEESKKGQDSSQTTGSTSSYARKYALNGLFCIDDNKDSDSTNKHGKEEQDIPVDLKKPENSRLSEPQIKRLFAIISKAGYELPKAKVAILKKYNITELEQLTKDQYDHICKSYEGVKK